MPKFSDAFIRNAPVGTHWEGNGFGCRVGKNTKTFIILLGSGKRHRIGRYPIISLAEARKRAQETIASHTLGLYRPTLKSLTFAEAVSFFLAASQAKNRPLTTEDYRLRLNRHWMPVFAKRSLAEITRQDITRAMLHPSHTERQHALNVLKRVFSWAVKTGHLEYDPTYKMPAVARYTPRERVLTPEETKTLYRVLSTDPDTYKRIVTLLLLTGQRRNEIARLEWDWIDGDSITIPSHISKNRRAHTFPIGPLAARVLATVPRLNKYVFPAAREHVRNKPTSCFNGWPKAKRQLDQKLKFNAHWTLHDLRRTYSSTLAQLGVRLEVSEKLLNHISGSISGVAAVYNRYRYQAEMKEAVDKYEQYISTLIRSELVPHECRDTPSTGVAR